MRHIRVHHADVVVSSACHRRLATSNEVLPRSPHIWSSQLSLLFAVLVTPQQHTYVKRTRILLDASAACHPSSRSVFCLAFVACLLQHRLYHEPVSLPCGHTYCRGCLKRALANKSQVRLLDYVDFDDPSV